MYVFYASSNRYVPYLAASIQSLFDNNKDLETLEVFICSDHISDDNRNKLSLLSERYSRKITFLDYSLLESVSLELNWRSQGGSYSTYSKLIMDQYLPSYVQRVLYIDSSDTLIVGSLKPLESLDMSRKAFAARVATAFYFRGDSVTYDHLIAQRKTYYNCGVFLVDLNNWKKMNCFDIIRTKSLEDPHFEIYDQTIINSYLPEEYGAILPIKYNFNGYVYSSYLVLKKLSYGNFYSAEEIKDASKHPVIIHWPGALHHPYVRGALCRRKKEYLFYLKTSYWKDDIEIKRVKDVLPKNKNMFYKIYPFIEFYLPRTSIFLYYAVRFLKQFKRNGDDK